MTLFSLHTRHFRSRAPCPTIHTIPSFLATARPHSHDYRHDDTMLRSVSRLGLARQQSSTARNWAVAAQRTVAGPSSYLPSAGSPNIQRAPDARPFSHATSVVRHAHEHGPHCNHEHVQIEPKLSLTFTCIVNECGHRSTHEFTRRSYERGIVIIQCPNCKNRWVTLAWMTEMNFDVRIAF